MTEVPPNHKDYIDRKIQESSDIFRVSTGLHLSGIISQSLRPLWLFLGKIESEYARPQLDEIKIDSPVYITGLARSGTTILLETLYKTDIFGSYTYKHYPFIYFPLLWDKIAKTSPTQNSQERAHFDRIQVHADSPEALEEMIWSAFFTKSFEQKDQMEITGKTSHKKFEAFYSDFIKKNLILTSRNRYLAKGNYNFSRIPYIVKNIPSAKFVICIRRSKDHISSLIKQHYLFCKIETENSRALNYMKWIGHHEFGLNRQPVFLGDSNRYQAIISDWKEGREIEGWARQWDYIYRFIYEKFLQNETLRKSIYLVKYEDLCQNPELELKKIFDFCQIPLSENTLQGLNISAPTYYSSSFSDEDTLKIKQITAETERHYYG